MRRRSKRIRLRRRSIAHFSLLVSAVAVVAALGTACAPRGFVIGTIVTAVPHGFIMVSVAGTPYHFHDGYFFRSRGPRYVVVAAPIGAVIRSLPRGYARVDRRDGPYAYYRGVFYKESPRGYAVARAPIGAEVPSIPNEAVRRRVDGVDYFDYGGTTFRRERRPSRVVYVVTEPRSRR